MESVKWDAWHDAGGHDDAGVHDEAGVGVNQSPSFKDLQYFERLCRPEDKSRVEIQHRPQFSPEFRNHRMRVLGVICRESMHRTVFRW